jgi:APA family basic amino acid/polyamine antiporter
MKYLDGATWVRFGVWLIIGLCIYALYGWRHSRLRGERQPGRARAEAATR